MGENNEIKILVVDDEESIVNFLRMGLEADGFQVYVAEDGLMALEVARKVKPNVIILDIMLPMLDGYQVCSEIKKELNTIIIMLTAREDIDDRVKGLDLGADDYMVKPFSYKELVARIKARLRSNSNEERNDITIGDFILNHGAHEIKYKNHLLELSLTEYNLLDYLLSNQGLVLSKGKILDRVWGHDFYGDENIVEVYIRYLRTKLQDSDHKIIQTVRGVGYKVVIDYEK